MARVAKTIARAAIHPATTRCTTDRNERRSVFRAEYQPCHGGGIVRGRLPAPRPDVIVGTVNSDGSTVTVANTGTDEADHFIQSAGPWMRPGYLPPMLDFEAGQSQRTADQMAQFALDFSNRIYSVMGIRPSIYINGSYNVTLQSASASLRNQLAQPIGNQPSLTSPAIPTLINAPLAQSGEPDTANRCAEHEPKRQLRADLRSMG